MVAATPAVSVSVSVKVVPNSYPGSVEGPASASGGVEVIVRAAVALGLGEGVGVVGELLPPQPARPSTARGTTTAIVRRIIVSLRGRGARTHTAGTRSGRNSPNIVPGARRGSS